MAADHKQETAQGKTGPVWVLAEQEAGEVLPVSFQMIGQARTLADQMGVRLEAVLLGQDTAALSEELISAGVDRVYLGDDAERFVAEVESIQL